jgi:mannose/fructose/N-acetylgalactosamine-specific phosphotransferase system component IIB
MSMAIPDRIKLRIVTIDEVLSLRDDKDLDGKRTLVIVSSIKDAFRLYTIGLDFSCLNIGNNKGTDSSKQISYSVWVDEDDLEMLCELMEKGIYVNLQSVPRERNIDMRSIMNMVKI